MLVGYWLDSQSSGVGSIDKKSTSPSGTGSVHAVRQRMDNFYAAALFEVFAGAFPRRGRRFCRRVLNLTICFALCSRRD